MKNKWQSFIRKSKEKYNSIRSIPSPAFNNETIHFDERGFNHLLMKNGRYRSKADQANRLRLIHKIPNIINSNKTYDEYREVSQSSFWTFIVQEKNRKIKVVVRRINNGKLHFFSVMVKKTVESTQAPEKGLL